MKDHHVDKKRSGGDSRTVTVTSKFSEADLTKVRPKLVVAKKSLSSFVRDAALAAGGRHVAGSRMDLPACKLISTIYGYGKHQKSNSRNAAPAWLEVL